MAENQTVLVITPMSLEYRAMRDQLVDCRKRTHPEGTIYTVGRVPGSHYDVALLLAGEGTANAAALAERSISFLRPRAVLVVGIAGALKDDIAIGDVVVATWVHSYHGGKQDISGSHARPRGWGASHPLEQRARMVDSDGSWVTSLQPQVRPSIHFKPIAAGDIVLNSREAPLALQLKEHYNDTAAIEMESAGVLSASHLNTSVPTLVIRGISDRADGEKHLSDSLGLQPMAALHAAAFAAALIKDVASDVADETSSESGITWRPLAAALRTSWLSDLGAEHSTMPTALELHVVPFGEGQRLEARKLATLGDEVAALGRARGVFTQTERLRILDPGTVASDAGAGLAVTRDGQRTVWQPLPRDTMGAILDPEDLMARLPLLLQLLVQVGPPLPREVGIALGLTKGHSVTEGRVANLPRTTAPLRLFSAPIRVPADDVVSSSAIDRDISGVAEELSARLMDALRRAR